MLDLLRCEYFLDRLCSFDEFLHHGVQLCEIILTLLDFCDKLLLSLELFLPLFLGLDAHLAFVLDASSHEFLFGEVLVLGELFEVFFGGDERKLHVFVAGVG